MITKREEVPQPFDSKFAFPRNRYALQVVAQEFKASRKDNMMIELDLQIIDPQFVEIGGLKTDVSGITLKKYLTCKVSDGAGGWDAQKSAQAQGFTFKDLEKMGVDVSAGIDFDNPQVDLMGRVVDCIVGDEEYKYTDANNKIVLDADGKQVIGHKPSLGIILGVSRTPANAF